MANAPAYVNLNRLHQEALPVWGDLIPTDMESAATLLLSKMTASPRDFAALALGSEETSTCQRN